MTTENHEFMVTSAKQTTTTGNRQCPRRHHRVFNPEDPVHADTSALVDHTANDFQLMANVLTHSDQSLINTSRLRGLLNEATNRWRPLVRSTSQVFEFRRSESEPSQGSA